MEDECIVHLYVPLFLILLMKDGKNAHVCTWYRRAAGRLGVNRMCEIAACPKLEEMGLKASEK